MNRRISPKSTISPDEFAVQISSSETTEVSARIQVLSQVSNLLKSESPEVECDDTELNPRHWENWANYFASGKGRFDDRRDAAGYQILINVLGAIEDVDGLWENQEAYRFQNWLIATWGTGHVLIDWNNQEASEKRYLTRMKGIFETFALHADPKLMMAVLNFEELYRSSKGEYRNIADMVFSYREHFNAIAEAHKLA